MDESVVKNQFIIEKKLSDIVSDKIDEMLVNAFEYTEDGDIPAALSIYDFVLKKEPSNIRALIDKGVTLQNMGKIKLAINSYNKALSISPENLDALLNKGATLHSNQKYQ